MMITQIDYDEKKQTDTAKISQISTERQKLVTYFHKILNFEYLFIKGGNPKQLENVLVLNIDPQSPFTKKAMINTNYTVQDIEINFDLLQTQDLDPKDIERQIIKSSKYLHKIGSNLQNKKVAENLFQKKEIFQKNKKLNKNKKMKINKLNLNIKIFQKQFLFLKWMLKKSFSIYKQKVKLIEKGFRFIYYIQKELVSEIKQTLKQNFSDYDYGILQEQKKLQNLQQKKKKVEKQNKLKLKKTLSYQQDLKDQEREIMYQKKQQHKENLKLQKQETKSKLQTQKQKKLQYDQFINDREQLKIKLNTQVQQNFQELFNKSQVKSVDSTNKFKIIKVFKEEQESLTFENSKLQNQLKQIKVQQEDMINKICNQTEKKIELQQDVQKQLKQKKRENLKKFKQIQNQISEAKEKQQNKLEKFQEILDEKHDQVQSLQTKKLEKIQKLKDDHQKLNQQVQLRLKEQEDNMFKQMDLKVDKMRQKSLRIEEQKQKKFQYEKEIKLLQTENIKALHQMHQSSDDLKHETNKLKFIEKLKKMNFDLDQFDLLEKPKNSEDESFSN